MADHLDPGDKNLQEAPLDQGDPQNEPNPPVIQHQPANQIPSEQANIL